MTRRARAALCAGLVALAALALPGPAALGQQTATAPPVLLLDTTMTVGRYTRTAGSRRLNGYLADPAAAGATTNTAGTIDVATFEYRGGEFTITQLLGGAYQPTGGAFRAVTQHGDALPVGQDSGTTIAVVLGASAVVRLSENELAFGTTDSPFHGFIGTGFTNMQVRVRLLDLGPQTPWRGRVQTSAALPLMASTRAGLRPGSALVTAKPPFFDYRGVTYTVDRLELLSDTVAGAGDHGRLDFSTTPDLPPDELALRVRSRSARGHARALSLATDTRTVSGVDYALLLPTSRDFDKITTTNLDWSTHLFPALGTRMDVLWSAEVTVGFFAGGTGQLGFAGRGTGFGALTERAVDLPDAPGSPALAFSVDVLAFTSDTSDRYTTLELRTSAGLSADQHRHLGLEVSGASGAHVYWLEDAAADNTGGSGDPNRFKWFPVGTGHAWADGETQRVRLLRTPLGETMTLALTPARVREGTPATVVATGTLNGPAFDTDTTWFLRAVVSGGGTRVTVGDAVTATLTADTRELTFAGVAVTVVDDDDVQASEHVEFHVCRTEAATPTSDADCVAGSRATRTVVVADDDTAEDILYWSTTLWPGETSAGAVGYVSSTPVVGRVSVEGFRCCRGREDDAPGQVVQVVTDDAAANIVRLALDNLLEDPADPNVQCPSNRALADRFRGAVLHVGDRALPLAGGSASTSAATSTFCTLAIPYATGGEMLVPDVPVRVRLTGPRHPRQLSTEKVVVAIAGGAATAGAGAWLDFHVRFDEPVEVAGTPALKFEIDDGARQAEYAGGSGSALLRFRYQVLATDSDDMIDVPEYLSGDSVAFDAGDGIVSVAHGRSAVFLGNGELVAQTVGVDGTAELPALTAMLRAAPVLESAGSLPFEILLSRAATSPLTIHYAVTAVSDDSDGRAATEEADFKLATGRLSVPTGSSRVAGEVEIVDDAVDEPDEVFRITAATADAGGLGEVVATILDDDLPVVGMDPPTTHDGGLLDGRVFEHEAEAGWTLTRDTGEWPLADLPELTVFVAVAGGDSSVGEVTFASGARTAQLSFIDNDDEREPTGQTPLHARLESGVQYAIAPGQTEYALELRDDDGAMVELTTDPAMYDVSEGATAHSLLVARTLADRATGAYASLTEPRDVERVLGPHFSLGYIPVRISPSGLGQYTGGARVDEDWNATDTNHTYHMRLDGFQATPDGRLAQKLPMRAIPTEVDMVEDDGEFIHLHLDNESALSAAEGRVVWGDGLSLGKITILEGVTLTLAFAFMQAVAGLTNPAGGVLTIRDGPAAGGTITSKPSNDTLAESATHTFGSTDIDPSDGTVTWNVRGTGNGTITNAGVYTPPDIGANKSVTVELLVNGGVVDTYTFTVTPVFVPVDSTQYAYVRAASAPTLPTPQGQRSASGVPSGWSTSALSSTTTRHVYRISRTISTLNGVFQSASTDWAWNPNTQPSVPWRQATTTTRTQFAYLRQTSSPTLPTSTTEALPGSWGGSALSATRTESVWRIRRTVTERLGEFVSATAWAWNPAGQPNTPWRPATELTVTEYAYIRTASAPALPTSTAEALPAGWSGTALTSTTALAVYRIARQKTTVSGTFDSATAWEWNPNTQPTAPWRDFVAASATQYAYFYGAAAPTLPTGTADGIPSGWLAASPSADANGHVYRISRTRRTRGGSFVSATAWAWAPATQPGTPWQQATTATRTQFAHRRGDPDTLPGLPTTRTEALPSGWSAANPGSTGSMAVYRISRTVTERLGEFVSATAWAWNPARGSQPYQDSSGDQQLRITKVIRNKTTGALAAVTFVITASELGGGTGYREIPVYSKIGLSAATPAAPSTLTWDSDTQTLGGLGSSWSTAFPTYDPNTEKVACAIVLVGTDDTASVVGSVRICESPGDVNAVFVRSVAAPRRLANSTTRTPTGTYNTQGAVPLGDGTVWVAIGNRLPNGTEWTWSAWSKLEGTDGVSTALVTVWKRHQTKPTDSPANGVTYSFVSGVLSGTLNGWSTTQPTSGTGKLWARVVSVRSRTATVTIDASDWSGVVQDEAGDGISSAAVFLYQRSDTEPSAPVRTVRYAFATGLSTWTGSGSQSGWQLTFGGTASQTGAKLWIAHAAAAGDGATDDIASGEWSIAEVAEDGVPGTDGSPGAATVFPYDDIGTTGNDGGYQFRKGANGVTPIAGDWVEIRDEATFLRIGFNDSNGVNRRRFLETLFIGVVIRWRVAADQWLAFEVTSLPTLVAGGTGIQVGIRSLTRDEPGTAVDIGAETAVRFEFSVPQRLPGPPGITRSFGYDDIGTTGNDGGYQFRKGANGVTPIAGDWVEIRDEATHLNVGNTTSDGTDVSSYLASRSVGEAVVWRVGVHRWIAWEITSNVAVGGTGRRFGLDFLDADETGVTSGVSIAPNTVVRLQFSGADAPGDGGVTLKPQNSYLVDSGGLAVDLPALQTELVGDGALTVS